MLKIIKSGAQIIRYLELVNMKISTYMNGRVFCKKMSWNSLAITGNPKTKMAEVRKQRSAINNVNTRSPARFLFPLMITRNIMLQNIPIPAIRPSRIAKTYSDMTIVVCSCDMNDEEDRARLPETRHEERNV